MLPQGPKGHRVGAKKKKSNVDPFRSLLIEFCYLQQPCPPPQTDVFSIRMSPFDCRPLTATSVSSHREEQTWGQMRDSQCAVKLKKKSMNWRIYSDTNASILSRFSMADSAQSDHPCLLSVALGFRKRRGSETKHVISHADGQTGLSVLQTCFIERDAMIGWAETAVKTKTLKNAADTRSHSK